MQLNIDGFKRIDVNRNWAVQAYEESKFGILRFVILSLVDNTEAEVIYHIEPKFIVYNTELRDPVKPVRDAIRENLLIRGHRIRKTFYTLAISAELSSLDDVLSRLESLKAHKKFYGNEKSIAESRYSYIMDYRDIFEEYDPAYFKHSTEKYGYVMSYINKK